VSNVASAHAFVVPTWVVPVNTNVPGRLSHRFLVVRAPSVRQIWAHVVPSDAGIVCTMSRSEERVRPEMACNWRSQQGIGEKCGPAYRWRVPIQCHAREGGYPEPERQQPPPLPPLDPGLRRDDTDGKRRAGNARRSDEPPSRHLRCQRVAPGPVPMEGDVEHRIDGRCPSYADHILARRRAGCPLRSGARPARRSGGRMGLWFRAHAERIGLGGSGGHGEVESRGSTQFPPLPPVEAAGSWHG